MLSLCIIILLTCQYVSPFEIVHGFSLRQPINLFSLPTDYRSSDCAQAFAEHIHKFACLD